MDRIKQTAVLTAFAIGGVFFLSFSSLDSSDFLVQLKQRFSSYADTLSSERVYLHFDRHIYKAGETVWFSAYLRNQSDLLPSSKSGIIHVEVIRPDGSNYKTLHLLVKDGNAEGDLYIGTDIPGGNYLIRAYTNWQLNNERLKIFERSMLIIPSSSQDVTFASENVTPELDNKITLRFFPEGGTLINGFKSKVAFQASDDHGNEINIEGVLLDPFGDTITEFKSMHSGMGVIEFTPKEGEYSAMVTKPAVSEGLAGTLSGRSAGMTLSNMSLHNGDLHFDILSTESNFIDLLIQVRGNICLTRSYNLDPGDNKFKVDTKDFPVGVAQVTLFHRGIPISERLVFVGMDKLSGISAEIPKTGKETNSRSRLNIQIKNSTGLPSAGIYSVAIVDDQLYSIRPDVSSNILSSLLLESDIQGEVSAPGFYFGDQEGSTDALDVLLMTRGWREFKVIDALDEKVPHVKFNFEQQIVSGVVINQKNGKPLKGVRILTTDYKHRTITNKKGAFRFDQLDLRKPTVLRFSYKNIVSTYQIPAYGSDLVLDLFKLVSDQEINTKYVTGIIEGTVKGTEGEIMPYANVIAMTSYGDFVKGTSADGNGKYQLILEPGDYQLKITYTGYDTIYINNITVLGNDSHEHDSLIVYSRELFDHFSSKDLSKKEYVDELNTVKPSLDIELNAKSKFLKEIEITAPPISDFKRIDPIGVILTDKDIKTMPYVNIGDFIALGGGFQPDIGDPVNMRGARSDANLYLVDGFVLRNPNLLPPINSVAKISVLMGGIPPYIGDVTGGVIIVETKSSHYSAKAIEKERIRKKIKSGPILAYHVAREFSEVILITEIPRKKMNTVYWNGNLKLDKNGKISITFYPNEISDRYRVIVEGISDEGIPQRLEKVIKVPRSD